MPTKFKTVNCIHLVDENKISHINYLYYKNFINENILEGEIIYYGDSSKYEEKIAIISKITEQNGTQMIHWFIYEK